MKSLSWTDGRIGIVTAQLKLTALARKQHYLLIYFFQNTHSIIIGDLIASALSLVNLNVSYLYGFEHKKDQTTALLISSDKVFALTETVGGNKGATLACAVASAASASLQVEAIKIIGYDNLVKGQSKWPQFSAVKTHLSLRCRSFSSFASIARTASWFSCAIDKANARMARRAK